MGVVTRNREYLARRIGYAAAALLQRGGSASLRGHTSKGVYIQTGSRWILFLSFGQSAGPLSITVEQDVPELEDVQPGAAVDIEQGRLRFPAERTVINVQAASVWRTPPVSGRASPRQEQLGRARYLARQAVMAKQGLGLSAVLPALLGEEGDGPSELSPENAAVFAAISRVRDGLAASMPSEVLAGAEMLLGRGRGLTPSGDDFFVGVMLGLRRWRAAENLGLDVDRLGAALVALAYERTTGLSGNLIECAVRGAADERLLALVDAIFCGTPAVADTVRAMLTWGSSSGVDAMTGMAVALLAMTQHSPERVSESSR
jgi:hypothetical protein